MQLQISLTSFACKILRHTALLLFLLLLYSHSAYAVSNSHAINHSVSHIHELNSSSVNLSALDNHDVQIIAEECIEEDDELIETSSEVDFSARTTHGTSTDSNLSPERISRFNAIPRYILYRNLKAYVLA